MAKILISFFVLLLFSFSNVCLGEELLFPFTVDQNIKNEDINQIPVEKDMQNDKWFMSPPTRLELLTYFIDQYFKKEFAKYWSLNSKEIEKYFEQGVRPFDIVLEDAFVLFNSAKDMFSANVTISNLGKPKKPMKETCCEILNSMSLRLEGGGYLYQNTFLGPFIQKGADDPEIVRIAEKLQKNFLVGVRLEAIFGKDQDGKPRDLYIMDCYKLLEEKEVHYRKQAIRLKR
jgi:hypothetical protein